MDKENRRKLFINSRVRNFFLFYVFFSIIIVAVFLGWEVIVEATLAYLPDSFRFIGAFRGFPMIVKVILLLLWGMFSFLLSYTYLDAKFVGIFFRMDDQFKLMLKEENVTLQFRKGDPFTYLSDSFNQMRGMFQSRIKRRRETIERLAEKIQNLPENTPESKLLEITKEIDNELAK